MTKRFIKPNPEEVRDYAAKLGYKVDGEYFCDYYESKGWVVGKAPMKCWQAAVRQWRRLDSARMTASAPRIAQDVTFCCDCSVCGWVGEVKAKQGTPLCIIDCPKCKHNSLTKAVK